MGQTAPRSIAFWLIFFISLSLLWQVVKPEQGLVPRTLNHQNFMALPNKLNGLTWWTHLLSDCLHGSSFPSLLHYPPRAEIPGICCFSCGQVHCPSSQVATLFAQQCLEASRTVLVIDVFWYWTMLSSNFISKTVTSYSAKVGVYALNLWRFNCTGCILSNCKSWGRMNVYFRGEGFGFKAQTCKWK